MNEIVDIAFTSAKIATSNNTAASLFVHGLSAGYNICQMGYYRSIVAERQVAMNNGYLVSVPEMDQYKRELAKHTALSILDVVGLFAIGFAACNRR